MQSNLQNMLENKQDTTSHKVLSLLAIWMMISVFGVLLSVLSVIFVFFIRDGSLSAILQNNASRSDGNVALISMIAGAGIGVALAIKVWETVMNRTQFVSREFVDKWLGGDLKKRKRGE